MLQNIPYIAIVFNAKFRFISQEHVRRLKCMQSQQGSSKWWEISLVPTALEVVVCSLKFYFIYSLNDYSLTETTNLSYSWYHCGGRKMSIIVGEENKRENYYCKTINSLDSYHDSPLHETLELSKSKKIIEVLSFVRTVLASLNKIFAIFSAKFSPSVEYLSLVCKTQC